MHLKTNTTRKRTRFHLDSDDSDQDVYLGGFTHKGKQIEGDDDFNEKIEHSSEDEGITDRPDKGYLPEEVVNELNFGGGEGQENHKKSRKEVFEEIMEKSKAFKEARKEVKNLNTELIQELDADFEDIQAMLNFSRKKDEPSKNEAAAKAELEGKVFDSNRAALQNDLRKAQPVKQVLTEHEQAQAKRKQLLEMASESEPKGNLEGRREKKLLDKRELAM